jgi:thioredoxin-related protein
MALLTQLYNTTMHFSSVQKQYLHWLIVIFMCLCVSGLLAAEAIENKYEVSVIASVRLDNVAVVSRNLGLPVLLVFASTECPYCDLLEDEILKPMLISGDYEDKVIIRKILIDIEHEIVDFNGILVAMDDFVTRHSVYVVPTILFFDHDGNELAKRLIGVNTIEMYGSIVDEAIEVSLKKLHK